MFPTRVYVIVAAAIALVAFGLGQLVPGSEMAFAAAASTLWVAYAVSRHRRLSRDR